MSLRLSHTQAEVLTYAAQGLPLYTDVTARDTRARGPAWRGRRSTILSLRRAGYLLDVSMLQTERGTLTSKGADALKKYRAKIAGQRLLTRL